MRRDGSLLLHDAFHGERVHIRLAVCHQAVQEALLLLGGATGKTC